MTPLSQTILQQYQVRKTQAQKSAFIKLLQQHFPDLKIQQGGLCKSRNLIIGDPEGAKVLLCAHYDTCAQLPFPNFIAPKNPILSFLYGLLLSVPIVILAIAANLLLGLLTGNYWLHYGLTLLVFLGSYFFMIAGPANKHNANDNTSGVTVLCELLQTLTPDLRSKAAFVFFDNEELGLFGSIHFRSKYKRLTREKLVINLDCVSDGNAILVSASKDARKEYGKLLKDSFLFETGKEILFANAEKTYYPSDQMGFKKSVAIAALKRKWYISYYLDKIHTAQDTIFDRSNIKYLCQSILRLLNNF